MVKIARRATACIAMACLLAAAASLPAAAQTIESAYSKIDWQRSCTLEDESKEGDGAWAKVVCDGFGNVPVRITDADNRMSLDYGAVQERGPWESFAGFNRVNETVEWRLADGKPFATIHRWFVSDDEGGERQVLVVSTVAGRWSRESCMVGFVDANANSNANLIARGLADAEARDFRCGVDRPAYVGQTTSRTPQATAGPN